MKILVIGCGSIGKRHIRNLILLNIKDLSAFDTDKAAFKEIRHISPLIKFSDNLDSLLGNRPDMAIIATPTSLHIPYAIEAAKAGCNLFVEKPLSHDMKKIKALKNIVKDKGLITVVGYNHRFNRCINRIKLLLEHNKIGKVLSCRGHFGSYLPERHPGEDYRLSYGARKDLGGGVILDSLSHHIDYMIYLLGKPKEVFCFCQKTSNLEMDTEDTAEIIMKFSTKIVATLHGDSLQRPYKHTLEIIGEKGTIVCDLFENILSCYTLPKRRWIKYKGDNNLNDMYVKELRHLLRCARRIDKPKVGLSRAEYELGLIMKIKKSARIKRWVKV